MDSTLALIIAFFATLAFGIAVGFMLGLAKGISMGKRLQSDRPISPIPWILCLVASVIFVLGAIGSSIYSLYFLSSSNQTQATVIEIVERKDSEGHVSRSPVYSYRDANGESFTDRTSNSDGREFSVGDTVPIRYLRNSPHQSRIDYFQHHWATPIVMGIFSMVTCGLGLGLRWWRQRQQEWLKAKLSQNPS